ncbi:hypothetical protein MXE38_06470 [Anaerobiospirillum sp. NML120448]|uniref:hypothetical protein n=1 Tax=Anaerobiospirillum sp. NML120448 TaxID=2932816 RepID=UPI001FF45543|nr:hypothetical protein [Anaerobiospirillum sp. NML120448]MCK0514498.1 hypothetical protein [Anaerobiospirillum sp. NML120448]
MVDSKKRSNLSAKALANRKFLISSWSSCFPKRPPSNKQELYANAKEYYAKLNNGGIFTCSGGDLSACIHELKEIYKSSNPNTLLSSSRYDPNAVPNSNLNVALDELGNELTRVATDYQNYLIKSVSMIVGSQINFKLHSIMEQNQEAKVKLEKALALLRANNIEFDACEFALSEPRAPPLDKHLNHAPYHHEATFCHSMANKSQQALNAVLHNVIPVLDQSIDKLLKDSSDLATKVATNADKPPYEQANLPAAANADTTTDKDTATATASAVAAKGSTPSSTDQSLSHNLASSISSLNSNITELNKLLANMTTALVNSNGKNKDKDKQPV